MTLPSEYQLELHQAARAYVQAGLSVIPTGNAGSYAKVPHSTALKATGASYWDDVRQSVAATWLPFQDRTATDAELRTWFLSMRAGGIALVTGALSGLIALDFDAGEGVSLLRKLGWEAHVKTPSGGYHVYLRHPGWRVPTLNAKSTRSLPAGLDVRADGGLIMLPPTSLDTGSYTRLERKKLLSLSDIPDELREVTGLQEGGHPAESTSTSISDVQQGERRDYRELLEIAGFVARRRGRNQGGVVLAQQLWHHGYKEWEALAIAGEWVDAQGRTNTKGRAEAYTTGHFKATVRSVYRHWDSRGVRA